MTVTQGVTAAMSHPGEWLWENGGWCAAPRSWPRRGWRRWTGYLRPPILPAEGP